jgi:hypothetical protein
MGEKRSKLERQRDGNCISKKKKKRLKGVVVG